MAEPHDFGRFCERIAATHLERRGWRVLERNFRLGHREIDLIVRRRDCVAFVEVKGRRGPEFGHPFEAITERKRREIERVALRWLVRNGSSRLTYRFDAVSVVVTGSGLRIDHLEDAWRIRA